MTGLLDFITAPVIALELEARDKEGAIQELFRLLVAADKLKQGDVGTLVDSVLERERLGSTGIGAGLAIPHVKASPLVDELVGAFGRSTRGIEWGASDGEPCHLFFLMVSPKEGVQVHLQILRKLATLGRSEHFCRFLRVAGTKDEVLATLQEVEAG